MTEPIVTYDTRWQCSNCGRFVAASMVDSDDFPDPDAYYGVSSRIWAYCTKCGRTDDPRCVMVHEQIWTAMGVS